MNDKYHRQRIEIIIDKESDLYKRICTAAETEGISIERVVDLVANLGITHHMADNTKFLYEKE